jgi:hypothetical protein
VNRTKKRGIFGKIKKSNPIAEYKNSIQFERTNEKGLSLTVLEQHPKAKVHKNEEDRGSHRQLSRSERKRAQRYSVWATPKGKSA